jgi:hypothetical protein
LETFTNNDKKKKTSDSEVIIAALYLHPIPKFKID